MIDKDYKKSIEELNSTKKTFEKRILPIKNTITWILANKISNKLFIEKTLDSLLEPVVFGVGDYEFHRLNNFYFTIFPQSAKKYRELYKKVCGRDY